MKNRPYLLLADVQRIGEAARAEATSNGWAVTIAIVDDGGHLLWLQRLDDAAPASAHIGRRRRGPLHWGGASRVCTRK
jgi:uncharacterized protein GlcG (DUF336 family)